MQEADVAVIGAGLSGLIAARELQFLGYDVLVLEAQKRPGGRIFTIPSEFGPLELGATWVHWSHPHLWAEIRRYDLEVELEAKFENVFIVQADQARSVPLEEYSLSFDQSLERIFSLSEGHFPEPFRTKFMPLASKELDTLTLGDRLTDEALTDFDRAVISGYLEALTGMENSTAGFRTFAHWWAAAGENVKGFSSLFDGARLREGTISLIEAILSDLDKPVQYAEAVEKIEQTESGATVYTQKNRVYRVNALVNATPINTWNRIEYFPSLPADFEEAAQARIGGSTSGYAYLITCRGKAPSTVFAFPEGEKLSSLFTYREDNEQHILKAYSLNKLKDPLKEVQRILDLASLPLTVERLYHHDWHADPYSMGVWAYQGINSLASLEKITEKQFDRVYFAGADISDGLNWLDGAVAEGTSAARAIHRNALKTAIL